MTLKRISALMVITAASLTASAAAPATATDSVSAAMATVWGSNIAPVLENRYHGDPHATEEFVKGLRQAFSLSPVDEPYYQGVLQGMALVERYNQMRQMGFSLSLPSFLESLGTALTGGDTGFTAESADNYLASYFSAHMNREPKLDAAAEQAFVDREAAADGAVRTPSGLVFQVLTEGEGAFPGDDDKVKVTYSGKLSDGTVFDEANTPVTLPVGRLVKGFTEGLKMMKPGGTYRLVIPASLGYGETGAGGAIPGNATLDFTVTLIGIE